MSSTAALILGGLAAAGGITSSVIGSKAAGKASDQQVAQEDKALNVQQNALDYTKQVEAPFVGLGNTSVSQLMDSFKNGTFGPGSLPSAPNISPFTLPTEADAAKTPGYQFALDQGLLGVNRGAAAAGGAFTGGTVKAGAGFAKDLASTTYNDTVRNSLSAYTANTNTQLQEYQAALAKQAQEYQQLFQPATLGANAAAGTATNVANASNAIAGTFGNIGQSQAAGTVGSANAITSGITGATNGITSSLLLNSFLNSQGSKAITNPVPFEQAGKYGPYNDYANLLTTG